MSDFGEIGTPVTRVAAPRGTDLTCRGWPQEAAYRMLQNNLDPEVAENPDELVVYGGTGRAARSWPAYRAMLHTLTTLAHDETMLVQSGKPVGVLRTHEWAPRVLIANSNLFVSHLLPLPLPTPLPLPLPCLICSSGYLTVIPLSFPLPSHPLPSCFSFRSFLRGCVLWVRFVTFTDRIRKY